MQNILIHNVDKSGLNEIIVHTDFTSEEMGKHYIAEGHTFDEIIGIPFDPIDLTHDYSPKWFTVSGNEQIRKSVKSFNPCLDTNNLLSRCREIHDHN